MLRNYTSLEITIDGKLFQFFCEQGSSTVPCKEALFQFQKMIGQIEDSAKAQKELNESPKVEEISQPLESNG